jgi:hypothetical protein
MTFVNANKLKELLIEDAIIGAKGFSGFKLLGLTTEGNSKSTVGYMFQEWLDDWMENKDIYHTSPENSQEPPDFFLSEDKTTNLLEIKVFDYSAGPNFDLANYEAYCNSLLIHPYKIDSDYLIFGYTLEKGVFSVHDIWLKKIWEITGPMNDFPIRIQRKKQMVYNIRPMKWYSDNCKNEPFNDKSLFISALQDSLTVYAKTRDEIGVNWLDKFNKSYETWRSSIPKES